jgi:tetratricopeptide (TPR) repeat protein
VHPEFQSIVDKCLEKEPQRRYSTAGQVVDHLLSVGPLPPPATSITLIRRAFRGGIRFVRIQWAATTLAACFAITGLVLLLILKNAEIQKEVIVYEINQLLATEEPSDVKKEVLEYLLSDELEQSSYEKILTRIQFSKTYPGKIPATEVTFNVRAHLLNTEIEVQMQRASTFPTIGGTTYDTTYQFGDPSMLLKGYMADIADKVLRFAGVAQKRISTFTPSWVAFESFYEGEKAWKKLETNTARQLYQKALGIDSNFVLARLRFADALRFEGAYAEAQVNVSMIEPHLGMLSIVDSLRARALIALLHGETWKHVDLLHEVLNYKPYAVESQYFLAEAYYQISDINQAKVYYLKALDIEPDYALAHNHLAYCYTYMGEHDSALVHFQKYLRLHSSANSYDSYGDGLFAAGSLDSAAWAKERGISLDRKMIFLPKTLFYIRSFQGQLKKAETSIVHFRGIAFTDDLRAQAEFFEGFVNYLMKRDIDALRHCLKALRIFDIKNVVSRNHDLHWLLGLIYLRLGQVDAATRELNEMEELVRDNKIDENNYRIYLFKSMLHLRACIAARQGDIQGLNKFAEELDGPLKTKVKDLGSPFDLSFYYTALGELYLEPAVNRPQDAEEYFNKSLLYNHRFPFAHHQLWLLYRRMNKPEQAAEHLRMLKEIWKDADPEWKAIYFSQQIKK